MKVIVELSEEEARAIKARTRVADAEGKLERKRRGPEKAELPDWAFQPGSAGYRIEDMPDWAFPPGSDGSRFGGKALK